MYHCTDDPAECVIVDCSQDDAITFCPKTCSEPKICAVADCTIPESLDFCPKKCGTGEQSDENNEDDTGIAG